MRVLFVIDGTPLIYRRIQRRGVGGPRGFNARAGLACGDARSTLVERI